MCISGDVLLSSHFIGNYEPKINMFSGMCCITSDICFEHSLFPTKLDKERQKDDIILPRMIFVVWLETVTTFIIRYNSSLNLILNF